MATTNTSKNESGLHDLKALANSAKRRRTKRRTTQMEVQNSLLASNAGLDAVVLPDPNKSVAVKMPVTSDKVEKKVAETSAKGAATKTSSAAAAAVVPSEIPSSPEESSNSKVGLIVVLGLAGAAAVAFLLMRGEGDATKQAEAGTPVKTPVGLADSEASTAAGTPGAEVADENIPDEVVTPDEALVAENGGGDEIDPEDPQTDPDKALTALDPEDPKEVKPEKPTRVLSDEEKEEAKRLRDERIAAKKLAREEAKANKIANAGTKEPGNKDKDKDKPGKDKTLSGGDSLDDVLSSVTGGLDKQVEKKDTAPVKKTLGRSDVKKAMSRVAGRAKACHAKEQYSGMVTVKYGVRPDGSLTSISATGSHAGSATGKCVVSAVKRAKFPAFAGSPMTFTFPFMLSP